MFINALISSMMEINTEARVSFFTAKTLRQLTEIRKGIAKHAKKKDLARKAWSAGRLRETNAEPHGLDPE